MQFHNLTFAYDKQKSPVSYLPIILNQVKIVSPWLGLKML